VTYVLGIGATSWRRRRVHSLVDVQYHVCGIRHTRGIYKLKTIVPCTKKQAKYAIVVSIFPTWQYDAISGEYV